jgi:hypothetical protein
LKKNKITHFEAEKKNRYLFCFRLSVAGNTHESPSNKQQQQQRRREREGKEAKTERTENEKVS